MGLHSGNEVSEDGGEAKGVNHGQDPGVLHCVKSFGEVPKNVDGFAVLELHLESKGVC